LVIESNPVPGREIGNYGNITAFLKLLIAVEITLPAVFSE
jgi:hypothetical protein